MSRAAAKPDANFTPDLDEAAFPLVVVRVGGEGTLIPPPPSNRGRRRTPTWPGLGTATGAASPFPPADVDEVDQLLALSEAPDSFYYPPE